MKASLNASEEEISMVTITTHPPHITHYQLINNNGLPVIRLGRLVRIHMTSLQRWLQDKEEITPL